MKVGSLKRLTPEDYPDIGNEIHPVFTTINDNLESVYTALNQRLTFAENFLSEVRAIQLKDSVADQITLKTVKTPVAVFHSSTLYDYSKLAWRSVKPGVIEVKIAWDSNPTQEIAVTLLIIGG
jgi:hypothetical protein